MITPSKQAQMKNNLQGGRKVKGMMGLAVHHTTNQAVDAVQLNTLDPNFNEDDILAEDEPVKKKGRGDDDFGMSSDEEKEIEKRK